MGGRGEPRPRSLVRILLKLFALFLLFDRSKWNVGFPRHGIFRLDLLSCTNAALHRHGRRLGALDMIWRVSAPTHRALSRLLGTNLPH